MEVLPLEICQMIWRCTIPPIVRAEIAFYETHRSLRQYYVSFSPRNLPVLFQVCRESRKEGHRCYTLLDPRPDSGARPVWLPDSSILFLDTHPTNLTSLLTLFANSYDQTKISHFAIRHTRSFHPLRQERLIEAVVRFFKEISHLTLVVESDETHQGVSDYWRAKFTNTTPPTIHVMSLEEIRNDQSR